MKVAKFLLVFSFAVVAGCTGVRPHTRPLAINLEEAWVVTDSLRDMLAVEPPDHLMDKKPKKNGTEFNLEEVFTVLKRLSMEEGWQADYDYHFDGMGGYPVVYACDANGKREALLQHVKSDNTADGFFQLALLTIMHDQFYLWWHAGYKAVSPIVTAKDLKNLPDEVATKVRPAALVPTVEETPDGEIVVRICIFRMWGGLAKVPIHMKLSFPHAPKVGIGGEVLAPYWSNIRF